jgi:hypothetical protein
LIIVSYYLDSTTTSKTQTSTDFGSFDKKLKILSKGGNTKCVTELTEH